MSSRPPLESYPPEGSRASSLGDEGRESSPLVASTAERLLVGIVGGTYPPGSRLPAERDLAPSLGASRATLREAFRQLEGMHLISARRGSGVTVRAIRDWSLEVLPIYLAAGAPYSRGGVHALLGEMLVLRKELVLVMCRLVAPRLAPGALATARLAATHAWEARAHPPLFAEREMLALQEICAAAEIHPTQWLLNTLASVYVKCAKLMPTGASPPPDYLEQMLGAMDALEGNDGVGACAILGHYFDGSSAAYLGALGR